MNFRKILFVLVFFTITGSLYAQNNNAPFANEIAAFKKQDSLNPPPARPIVFIGSSSFTKWTNVQEMFPGYTILNRGFGGSMLPDLVRYVDDVVFRYNPKQIVIYCGENDVASSDTVDSREVAARFKTLFWAIRNKMPDVQIVYVSMKPSPSRDNVRKTVIQGNQIIKNYLYTQRNVLYVDVFSKMLDADGNSRKELFVSDMLHMNQDGYKIWQAAIQPYLMKN